MVVAYRTGEGRQSAYQTGMGRQGHTVGKTGWICISTTITNTTEGAKTRFDLGQRK